MSVEPSNTGIGCHDSSASEFQSVACDFFRGIMRGNFYNMVAFSFGRPPMAPLSTGPIWFHRGGTIDRE